MTPLHPPAAPRWPSFDEVLPRLRELLAGARRIACVTHVDADADSLGSALAMALALRARGRDVSVVTPPPLPLLPHLPGAETALWELPAVDLVLVFDCSAVSQLGNLGSLVEGDTPVVNIDHHVTNDGFGSLQLVDPLASATGELVWRLLSELGLPVDAAVATNLYAALFTDTGGLRNSRTTAALLRTCAALVEAGADPQAIADASYGARSPAQIRLEGLAFAALRTDDAGTVAWTQVTQAMVLQSGADARDGDGVIDRVFSLATAQVAFVLREVAPGEVKVSMRTREPFDASAICHGLGGGGHLRLAGAMLQSTPAAAERRVLAAVREALRSEGLEGEEPSGPGSAVA